WLSPYHPSGNSHGCRAVGDVLRHHRTGPGARLFAQFDGRDQHRVDAHERALSDLCPVLVRAVEIGRDRTGADVGVRAQVGVAEVGDVRHPGAAGHPGAHQLGQAADVDVLGDLGAGPELGEGAAVGAVADPRVLYIHVRSDAALGADLRFALDHAEGLDHGVGADGHAGVDEGRVRVDDGDPAEHQSLQEPAPQHVGGPGEPDAVLHAHGLIGVVEPDHVHRLEVQEDVGQVELARLVVVGDLVQLPGKPAAVEQVEADVELVHHGTQLRRRVFALDDLLQRAVAATHDPAVVARPVFHARDGRRRLVLLVLVDDLEHARGCEQGRVAVDDQDLAAAQLAGRDLPQRVGGALRVALIDDLRAAVEMSGDVGVVRVGDHRNLLRAGLVDSLKHPVD